MRKLFLFGLTLAIISSVIVSCTKKSNTINDGEVIETPYSLYFTDIYGALYNTNDGKSTKVIFTSDGTPSRSFITDGANILWARNDLFVSVNNGVNFNYSYQVPYISTDGFVNVKGVPCGLNQSMLINVPSWEHAYVSSRETATGNNYFGMAENYSGGTYGNWHQENLYDTDEIVDPHTEPYITSFTLLKGDTLVAYGAPTQITMYRTGATARWLKVYAASPLPLDSSKAWFSLGHINGRLIAIDNKGTATVNGGSPAYYSDDKGNSWTPYSGLPAATPLMCISSPFEQICLVGTDGMGLYLLNPNVNTFQQVTAGLPPGLVVRNIAFKQNIYKNGTKQQYIYLATDQGLYQSVDMAASFTKVVVGNFVTVY